MRPEEERSFEPREIRLEDPSEAEYWSSQLEASREEIEQAVAKVGPNRTAVEIYLGVANPGPRAAGPSEA